MSRAALQGRSGCLMIHMAAQKTGHLFLHEDVQSKVQSHIIYVAIK